MKVQNGDRVIFDFAGFIDGIQFPGGTAKNYQLTIGSGQFIPGFEDGMIGMKEGEEKDIPVTFPTNYHAAEFAGKESIFKVKVYEIRGTR